MAKEKLQNPDDEAISLAGPDDDEPISLVEEGETGTATLRAFGAGVAQEARRSQFQRAPNVTGQGAIRCRVFHSKIAATSLEYMESQINEWLDGEAIEIKQVGHVIGVLEGKTPEPNLIVVLWY